MASKLMFVIIVHGVLFAVFDTGIIFFLDCFFINDRTLDRNAFANLSPNIGTRLVALSIMIRLGP